MSYVTDAAVLCHGRMTRVQDAIRAARFGANEDQAFGLIDDKGVGGPKCWGTSVWGAGFNYVSVHDLVDWFRALPWSDYDDAVLTAQTEDQPCMVAVRSQGRTWTVGWNAEDRA